MSYLGKTNSPFLTLQSRKEMLSGVFLKVGITPTLNPHEVRRK